MAQSAMGIAVTRVSTSMEMPLGYIHVEPAQSVGTDVGQGERKWVYIFNDDGTNAFAVGDIVIRDPSVTTNAMYGAIIAPITLAAAAHSVLGVAQHAIPVGSYGFVLCHGQGLVKNGTTNITADTQITSGGTRVGSAIDYVDITAGATGLMVIGWSLEAEATDNTTFDAFINCIGA